MESKELMKLRRAAKLTQSQTAEAMGFTLRGYQKLESGESPLKPHHIRALEAIFTKDAEMTKPVFSPEDATVFIDANLKLIDALIKKLVNLNVIENVDVADMLTDIIETDKRTGHPNAAAVEKVLRQLFVK